MSYVSSYYHCVFSTTDRRPIISTSLQERLWPFMGGIARENGMKAIEIGGVEDHMHMLLSNACKPFLCSVDLCALPNHR